MKTRVLEGIRYCLENEEKPVNFEYYLVESLEENRRSYSVEVIKKEKSLDTELLVETESSQLFSTTIEDAREIINKLIGNIVTPITLIDCIENLQAI